MFDFLELKCEENLENENLGESSENIVLDCGVKTTLDIKDITFRYGEKNVFDHWNLNIGPNEKIMLKGESGCGKSTLLKLLLDSMTVRKATYTLTNGICISILRQY